MQNPLLTKSFDAAGAIASYRLVKLGSADGEVEQAAAGTDVVIGVSGLVAADGAGERIDIYLVGAVEVEYGAAVSRGDRLAANASGQGVPATAGDAVIGLALEAGVSGDIGSVLLAPSAL